MSIFQGNYTYLFLNLFTICGPLLLSFDKKVAFHKNWRLFFMSMLPTSMAYIIWDVLFTHYNIWRFNPSYLIGVNIGNLPIEEYIFFLVVPYSCLFIYVCLKAYLPNINSPKFNRYATLFVIIFSIAIASLTSNKAYTCTTFALLSLTFIAMYIKGQTQHVTYLLLAWTVALLPMSFVNGILTSNPVLIYNDAQNLGIRIGSIPVEDFFYNLLYMSWMIGLYEFFNKKQNSTP